MTANFAMKTNPSLINNDIVVSHGSIQAVDDRETMQDGKQIGLDERQR